MKLSILLAGSILTSAIVGNVYAQTCGAQPSCSSLGYTYTGSTSDCVNTPMKCPFNTSYFNCTKKADALAKLQTDIVTAAMPDYSRAQSRNKGQQYTAFCSPHSRENNSARSAGISVGASCNTRGQ